ARRSAAAGKTLVERLAIYPSYALDADRWLDPALAPAVRRAIDSEGFARTDGWAPGVAENAPAEIRVSAPAVRTDDLVPTLDKAAAGQRLEAAEIVDLFAARGSRFDAVVQAADAVRRDVCGSTVTYVVNRNINYTNICSYACRFCAFSKGRSSAGLRGTPYDLDLEEISRRVREAWDRGATEVCLQGGIHPDYTGETYVSITRAVKTAAPDMHVHAFSPLEISQGAATLGLAVDAFLERLIDAGLGSLPGTAAEILDPAVRKILCPDKVTVSEWLAVIRTAHRLGLRTTATIMFGSVEGSASWARHLNAIRDLQEETGGFTEFVPLPFVHMEAPIYLRGKARKGPTWREGVLMHAVARLALNPVIPNIQVSWVKMGRRGAAACLDAGVNDLGGTLMNESISRAAGTTHGQELPPEEMDALIRRAGRLPLQRSTVYGAVTEERIAAGRAAPPLEPIAAAR
ncbi:MAG: 5-amino-6-(D-ribitylamino)uracil--L-tyrosine 4-hydroxyphenyl transferase CofH, partial [Defluviicoccus sp.]|nr:5-amino-6-(D-ribitylamino)uracil--L-tyrosine 4-hydroxyphenyl transferase CofH [Defluviicoccus sp.]